MSNIRWGDVVDGFSDVTGCTECGSYTPTNNPSVLIKAIGAVNTASNTSAFVVPKGKGSGGRGI